MAGPTACEVRWKEVLASFAREEEEEELRTEYPDAREDIYLIQSALVTIGQLVRASPRENGNGVAWKNLADKAEAERVVLEQTHGWEGALHSRTASLRNDA
jgi:hypothetical protein